MTTETYVFGEIEVKKTGRQAEKKMPGTRAPLIVEEITPVNDYDGTWKKWVQPSALFTIKPTTDEPKEEAPSWPPEPIP